MDVVFSAADSITVLHRADLIAEGASADIRANSEVRRVYLGRAGERSCSRRRRDQHLYGLSRALFDVSITVEHGQVSACGTQRRG